MAEKKSGVDEPLSEEHSSIKSFYDALQDGQKNPFSEMEASLEPMRKALDQFNRMRPHKIKSVENMGVIIRQVRKEMGLTQQEFADLAGVGRRFISELENGKETLEFGKVLKACDAAGLDITARGR